MKKSILLSLFLVASVLAVHGSVRLQLLTQSGQPDEGQKLGKITFVGESMQVLDSEGNLIVETPIEEEPVISVNVEESVVEITDNTGEEHSIVIEVAVDNTTAELTVSPNPMRDVISVRGAEQGSMIRIYALGGELVREAKVSTALTTLCVHDLDNGVYLMRVNNNLVKLIKQ